MIKNGELADADEVLNLTGKIFKNQLNLMANASRIGWNSKVAVIGSPQLQDNTIINNKTTNVDRTNTTMHYDSLNFIWFAADTVDDCNDGSYSTLWNTSISGYGSVSEGTSTNPEDSALTITASSSGTSGSSTVRALLNKGGAPNLKSEDSSLFILSRGARSGGSSTCSSVIKMTDGTNYVTLFTLGESTGGYGNSRFLRIDINTSTKNAYIYSNWGLTPTTVSLSTLTGGTWSLLGESVCNWSSSETVTVTTEFYYITRVTASTSSKYLVTTNSTTDTVTNALACYLYNKSTNAITSLYLSADGTNYTQSTGEGIITNLTPTGTTLKLKIAGNPNKQSGSFDYFALSDWGVMYNLR